MVKRLRRRPLTAETGVRFPVVLPKATKAGSDKKSEPALVFAKDCFGINLKPT